MSSVNTKELLLHSVVSGKVAELGPKLDFWQMKHEDVSTLWESDKPLKLEAVLDMIDPEEDIQDSKDFALLYGIGWEFVVGQKPPEYVNTLRRELIEKAHGYQELSKLEFLWHRIICVGTYLF